MSLFSTRCATAAGMIVRSSSSAVAALLLLAAPVAAVEPAEVPVGGAVAYFGPADALPPGWVPCDGRLVAIPDSPLNGRRLPDLRGMFLRGAGTEGAVGKIGGSDTLRLRPGGGHDHGGRTMAGGNTAAGRTGVVGIHRHTGRTSTAGGGLSTSGPLPGSPGGFSQQSSAHQHSLDTGMGGEHSHTLPAADTHVHSIAPAPDHTHRGDNLPRHVAALFICRVK